MYDRASTNLHHLQKRQGADGDGQTDHQVEPEAGWVDMEVQPVLNINDVTGAGQTSGRHRRNFGGRSEISLGNIINCELLDNLRTISQ